MSASWFTIAIAAEQNPPAAQAGDAAAPQTAPAQEMPRAVPQAAPQAAGTGSQPDPETGYTKGSGETSVFSTAAIGQKTLEARGADSTYDAIKNVSGVSYANTKSGDFADDLQIRGIHLISTASYRLDGGLAIVNNTWMPPYDKETVQALKGASALFFGIVNPGGVINYVTKRPTDEPYTAVSFSGTGYGQVVGAIDWSRRFGENNQIGVRINLAATDYQTFIPGVDGSREFGSVAVDWDPSDRLSFKFTYEAWNFNVTEQATLLLPVAIAGTGGGPSSFCLTNPDACRIFLPNHPDPTKNLAGPNAQYDATGQNAQLQTQYLLGDGWKLLANIGQSDIIKWMRNTEQFQPGGPGKTCPKGSPPSCVPTTPTLAQILNGSGQMVVTDLRDQHSINNQVDLEAKNHFEYSFITNDFTFGVARNERFYNFPTSNKANTTLSAGYFYNPDPSLLNTTVTGNPIVDHPTDSIDYDVFTYDQINLWDRLHLVAGVRHVNYHYDAASTVGGPDHIENTQISTPSYGAVLDLTKQISLYASYLRGLEELGSAPQSAANAYQVLPPALSVQQEVGVRVDNLYRTSGSVGYFTINRANAVVSPSTNIYGLDGSINYTGLETNVRHRITEEWIIGGAAQWTKAVENAPGDPQINGKIAENTPFFGGNAYLTYRPWYIEGLSLTAGTSYIGKREINALDQGKLPSVELYNFGATYRTILWDRNWTFNLNGTNLTDVRWWSAAYNNNLGVGAPFTLRFGMKVEF
jgi:iron complex outermembrane receptor protein